MLSADSDEKILSKILADVQRHQDPSGKSHGKVSNSFFFLAGIPRLPPMNLSHNCNTSETRESEVLILSNLNPSSSVIQLAQAFHIQRNLLLGLSIL